MPTYSWDPVSKRFRDPKGRYIPEADVRKLLNVAIDHKAIVRLTLDYKRDNISRETWHEGMRGIIKKAYVQAAMLAKGGRNAMTPADWGKVGGHVAEQYYHLDRKANSFLDQIDDLTEKQAVARARMYVESCRQVFEEIYRDNKVEIGAVYEKWILSGALESCVDCIDLSRLGIVPIGTLGTVPGAGDTECLTNCGCRIAYYKPNRRRLSEYVEISSQDVVSYLLSQGQPFSVYVGTSLGDVVVPGEVSEDSHLYQKLGEKENTRETGTLSPKSLEELLLSSHAMWEYDGAYHILGGPGSGYRGHSGGRGGKGRPGGSRPRSRGTVEFVHGRILDITEVKVIDRIAAALESGDDDAFFALYGDGTIDPVLAEIASIQGFDGLPSVVSKEELDSLVASGVTELWRGEKKEEYAEMFRTGIYHAGTGMYGNGIYTAPEYVARDYSKQGESSLLRMGLHKDARIASLQDISALKTAAKDARRVDVSIPKTLREERVAATRNHGVLAALAGYDAYHTRSGVIVILNRTAIFVQE